MDAHADHDKALALARYLLSYPASASGPCYRAIEVRWDLGVPTTRWSRRSDGSLKGARGTYLVKTVPVPHEPRRGRCVRCGRQLG